MPDRDVFRIPKRIHVLIRFTKKHRTFEERQNSCRGSLGVKIGSESNASTAFRAAPLLM